MPEKVYEFPGFKAEVVGRAGEWEAVVVERVDKMPGVPNFISGWQDPESGYYDEREVHWTEAEARQRFEGRHSAPVW